MQSLHQLVLVESKSCSQSQAVTSHNISWDPNSCDLEIKVSELVSYNLMTFGRSKENLPRLQSSSLYLTLSSFKSACSIRRHRCKVVTIIPYETRVSFIFSPKLCSEIVLNCSRIEIGVMIGNILVVSSHCTRGSLENRASQIRSNCCLSLSCVVYLEDLTMFRSKKEISGRV